MNFRLEIAQYHIHFYEYQDWYAGPMKNMGILSNWDAQGNRQIILEVDSQEETLSIFLAKVKIFVQDMQNTIKTTSVVLPSGSTAVSLGSGQMSTDMQSVGTFFEIYEHQSKYYLEYARDTHYSLNASNANEACIEVIDLFSDLYARGISVDYYVPAGMNTREMKDVKTTAEQELKAVLPWPAHLRYEITDEQAKEIYNNDGTLLQKLNTFGRHEKAAYALIDGQVVVSSSPSWRWKRGIDAEIFGTGRTYSNWYTGAKKEKEDRQADK